MNVCHVILVVQDSLHDTKVINLIDRAAGLKPTMFTSRAGGLETPPRLNSPSTPLQPPQPSLSVTGQLNNSKNHHHISMTPTTAIQDPSKLGETLAAASFGELNSGVSLRRRPSCADQPVETCIGCASTSADLSRRSRHMHQQQHHQQEVSQQAESTGIALTE
ncbi:unnamed protein product [Protopolystoma xenopodis]|uniref:Uncharacterized protein n=1 Tax=Protopolystoma xenopodis TaxID=117903 RepID=A0A448XRT9_9PLAT|nr:unnamed protein product [Protopolystoma xenopodis]